MTKRKHKNTERPWLIYLVATILSTFALMKTIESKNEIFFWTYFTVVGISTLVTKWYSFSKKRNLFIIAMEHICIVFGLTLFLWGFINWLFPNFKI